MTKLWKVEFEDLFFWTKVKSIYFKTFTFQQITLVFRWTDLTIPAEISYPTQTIFFQISHPVVRDNGKCLWGKKGGVGVLKLQLTPANN